MVGICTEEDTDVVAITITISFYTSTQLNNCWCQKHLLLPHDNFAGYFGDC